MTQGVYGACGNANENLQSPKVAGPAEEFRQAPAFSPQQMKEMARVQRLRVAAEKRLHPPADVGTPPGLEAVALGRDPVVAQRGEQTNYREAATRIRSSVSIMARSSD